MRALKVIGGLLFVFVTCPIWYYLLYHILVAIHASELMFFLFWVYVPVGLFVAIATQIASAAEEKE